MAKLRWALATERAVGQGGAYTDVINRALRDLLTQSGVDPDDDTAVAQVAVVPPGRQVDTLTAYLANNLGQTFNVEDYIELADGADEWPCVQAACDAAGAVGRGTVIFNRIYNVSKAVTPSSNTRLFGGGVGGGGLKALSGSDFTSTLGLVVADGKTNVVVEMMELNGNACTGVYGLYFKNGSACTYRGNYIHDTYNAGISDLDQYDTEVSGNRLINCGRSGPTDNHGIMLGSVAARGSKGARIIGNRVDTAFRKGITVFSFSPGTTRTVVISGNAVENCGLGGLYLGGSAAGLCTDFAVTANVVRGNYTNILADFLYDSTISGNAASDSTGDRNINLSRSSDLTVCNNALARSFIEQIYATACSDMTIVGNTMRDGNTSGVAAPAAIAIHLSGTTNCTVVLNKVRDANGHTQYGYLEESSSDNNTVRDNQIRDATVAAYSVGGASTTCDQSTGGKVGINTTAPANTLDIAGGVTVREKFLPLVNGANNNVVLPSGAGTLAITGPSGAFNITGIAGGVAGREIWILNTTAQTMTISHSSGSSSAGNKILIGGSADLAISSFGAVRLTYSAGVGNAWMVTGYKA